MPSLLALQTHPKYWQDPLLWQPSRWISSSPGTPGSSGFQAGLGLATRLRPEALVTPARSTYFPWSDGPQNCPGAKFAPFEFVSMLARLLRDHRVSILRESKDESFEEAKKRALAATEDCDKQLLLRMRNADKVRLACKRV
jgi:cytochrome P450